MSDCAEREPAIGLPNVSADEVAVLAYTSGTTGDPKGVIHDHRTTALTAVAFDGEGWYHSGDVGILDRDGYLTITDRVKDIIIRGGENISATEVEEALQTLPGVAEIAVVAAPDERLGEHACAIVRMLPGAAPVTLGAATAHLAGVGLARQKWPEELRFVDDFPRTASGKIRKIDLRARLRAAQHD
jgi:acyl-CoA synthetase (AMP-forming)/AMP-acid ligase II